MMVLFPNYSKAGDNMLYLFFQQDSAELLFILLLPDHKLSKQAQLLSVSHDLPLLMNMFPSPKVQRSWKVIFFRLSKHQLHALNFHVQPICWRQVKNSMKSNKIPIIFMSPNNSKSFTSIRNTKPCEGNQCKNAAKHYPRIHPAGKVFGQPPFCVSMAIPSETTPYIITTVIIITIYYHIFNILNRKQGNIKVKSADVICQTSIISRLSA